MTLDEIPLAPLQEEEEERESVEESYLQVVQLLLEGLDLMETSVKMLPKLSQTGNTKIHIKDLKNHIDEIKLFVDLMS